MVKTDPFEGNKCSDKKCLPNNNPKNKISCRRNCICYRITCILCLQAARSGDMSTTYYGESGKNMHCRAKEHASKFHSKKEHIRNKSAFHKHLMNTHGGSDAVKTFSDYFEIVILKAYKKAFTKCVEEGTYIANCQVSPWMCCLPRSCSGPVFLVHVHVFSFTFRSCLPRSRSGPGAPRLYHPGLATPLPSCL